MFESLSDKLIGSLKKLKGQGKLTSENIEAALKEVRLSLLEADVNFKVVKDFVSKVQAKALGQEVLSDLNPGQQVIKIVHDELAALMGGVQATLELRPDHKPHSILMVGLQGAGKTTSTAKFGLFVKKKMGRQPLLVPADVYRPAAIEQLKTLGKQYGLDVFDTQPGQTPQEIVRKASEFAKENGKDVLIVDTAGRLQIDASLMNELGELKTLLNPDEILLVADAMTGQEAVNIAQGFNEKLGLTGVMLTKLDGDARGGAALSIKAATGAPIKFVGTGEKADALEPFFPDRMASRILDMGDLMSLVEKAAENFDLSQAETLQKKMRRNEFTVEDFLIQLQQIKKMGPLEGILKMLPGMGQLSKQLKNMSPPEKEMKKIEAIIHSMTRGERQNHEILNGSRRARIARGSGTQVSDVNKFIKQFREMRKMMQMFSKMGAGSPRGGRGGPFGGMGFPF